MTGVCRVPYGELTMVRLDSSRSGTNSFAVPKSATLACQLSSNSTLEGFRSLWTTLSPDPSCMYATPCAMPWMISSLCLQLSVPRRLGSPARHRCFLSLANQTQRHAEETLMICEFRF